MDSQRILASSHDRTLRILDARTGETLSIFKDQLTGISNLEILDSRRVIASYHGRTLRVLDVETGKALSTFEIRLGHLAELAVLDSRRIVATSYDGTFVVLDVETGKTIRALKKLNSIKAIASRGQSAALCTFEGALELWDLEKDVRLFDVTLDSPVLVVAVAQNKRVVMAGDRAGSVHFLDWVKPE